MVPTLSTLALLVLSTFPTSLAQAVPSVLSPVSLARYLAPGSASTADLSVVTGQVLDLAPFTLSVVTNATDALVSFNVSQPIDEIGWIAVGLGTQMGDSAMVILWPTTSSTSGPSSSTESASNNWIVSHRTAGGHFQPDFDPSTLSVESAARWSIVDSLSSDLSSASSSNTIVTLRRRLVVPLAPALEVYPKSRTRYLNLSTTDEKNKVIYAASSERPPYDEQGSTMRMHDPKMFGAVEVDLTQAYVRTAQSSATTTRAAVGTGTASASRVGATATGSRPGDARATEQGMINEIKGSEMPPLGWTKVDRIVAVHAGFAMVAWLVIAPFAVLIARVVRKWGNWFRWHSRIQFFGTWPLTLATMSLGLGAASTLGSIQDLDSHKTLGFVLVLLVTFQLLLGHLSHTAHYSPSRSSTRPLVRVFHILVGISIMPVAWTTLSFGIAEWSETRPEVARPLQIVLLVGIVLFVVPYVSSLLFLAIHRLNEGRTLYHALFGLGRSSASPSTHRGREWARGMFASAGDLPTSKDRAGSSSASGMAATAGFATRNSLIEGSERYARDARGGGGGGGGSSGQGSPRDGEGGIKRRSLSQSTFEVVVEKEASRGSISRDEDDHDVKRG
ncbi:hypothetical protein JCM10212_003471 [Sporobolomyces blumeae]